MAKITKNTTPKKEHSNNELVEILLNQYVKYKALKEVLVNKGAITEDQLKQLVGTQYAKDQTTEQAKEYAKLLDVTITESTTIETAQSVISALIGK